jgi:hypothetical protein
MRCSEPGHRAPAAIHAPCGPGRTKTQSLLFRVFSILSDFLVLIVSDIDFSLSCRRRPQFARILFSAPTIIIT